MLVPAGVQSQSPAPDLPDSIRVSVSGFADLYYAYDFRRPPTADRTFTTQPARHNEFNVNLAFVEARVSGSSVRGRVALQAGTSVQSNYGAEPRLGTISGHDLSRLLQEANAGVRVRPGLWIDAGVFFSHIGSESWISRDNTTYTRSLVAEFTPYYEAGVRVTWAPVSRLSAQLNLINGWQNVSETNSDKAIGVRLDYAPSPRLTVSYDNFIGNEAPDSVRSRTRVFHEVAVRSNPGERAQLLLLAQRGSEARPGAASAEWYGGVAIGRAALTRALAATARVEFYSDPDQVLVATGTSDGLEASGASLGVDLVLAPGLVWRTEIRAFRFTNPVYPTRPAGRMADSDAFAVTAFSFTAPSISVTR